MRNATLRWRMCSLRAGCSLCDGAPNVPEATPTHSRAGPSMPTCSLWSCLLTRSERQTIIFREPDGALEGAQLAPTITGKGTSP